MSFSSGASGRPRVLAGLPVLRCAPIFSSNCASSTACLSPRLTSRGDLLQALLDGLQVGQDQFGGDDLDVPHRVNVAGDVDDVRVFEAADDMDEGVHLADVAEELVAEALAVGGAFDEAGDVHELEGGGDLGVDLGDFGELGEARVGHADDAEVGFDGAERVILRRGLVGAGDGVEEGGFPHVRETDDACLKHGGVIAMRLGKTNGKSESNGR